MRKTIIITGANRGIGRACVKAFAEHSYDIWACARKPSEAFEADMAEETPGAGPANNPERKAGCGRAAQLRRDSIQRAVYHDPDG